MHEIASTSHGILDKWIEHFEHRPAVPVVEPREYRSRRFYIIPEVELVKFGYSEGCDGCNAEQLGTDSNLTAKRADNVSGRP